MGCIRHVPGCVDNGALKAVSCTSQGGGGHLTAVDGHLRLYAKVWYAFVALIAGYAGAGGGVASCSAETATVFQFMKAVEEPSKCRAVTLTLLLV